MQPNPESVSLIVRRRRRNPYSEAVFPALVAAADGPLRAWLQARAADVDRVIGEATDDLLAGAVAFREVEDRITRKVESAYRAHPGLIAAGLVDLALATYGRVHALMLAQKEGSSLSRDFDPFPFDFREYAVKRWETVTGRRDVPQSPESSKRALALLGPYTLETSKSGRVCQARISATKEGGVVEPVSIFFRYGLKNAIENAILSREFGYKLAKEAIAAAGISPQIIFESIPVSRGGVRRVRQYREEQEKTARELAAQREERERRNKEIARDFLNRTSELLTAFKNHPGMQDLRSLKKALPPGFTASRTGGAASPIVIRFGQYHWMGNKENRPGSSVESFYYYLLQLRDYTPENFIENAYHSGGHWYAPILSA